MRYRVKATSLLSVKGLKDKRLTCLFYKQGREVAHSLPVCFIRNNFIRRLNNQFLTENVSISKVTSLLSVKEVIQPHLPVRLPCYDFTPVTSPALGVPLPRVGETASGWADSSSVTGGVYKARERIHRRMADRRLLAIPTSCRRVAAYNPN